MIGWHRHNERHGIGLRQRSWHEVGLLPVHESERTVVAQIAQKIRVEGHHVLQLGEALINPSAGPGVAVRGVEIAVANPTGPDHLNVAQRVLRLGRDDADYRQTRRIELDPIALLPAAADPLGTEAITQTALSLIKHLELARRWRRDVPPLVVAAEQQIAHTIEPHRLTVARRKTSRPTVFVQVETIQLFGIPRPVALGDDLGPLHLVDKGPVGTPTRQLGQIHGQRRVGVEFTRVRVTGNQGGTE